jgi:mannose-1-phosphate guanylyltransferase
MNTNTSPHYAVILAGGSGIRLWPLSRESMPKQLIPVLDGKSLMEAAFDRLEGVIPPEHRWICGGARYETAVRATIPAIGHYIGEPEGRDTLPAIALSCALVSNQAPDAIIAFLTSDHIIEPVEHFRDALRTAFATVQAHPDTLVTFGVPPTFPSTAYGYLEMGSDPFFELGEPLESAGVGAEQTLLARIRRVRRFREKPDQPTAERFLAEGPEHYLWNSGMFVFKASRLLELLAKYEPQIADAIERITRPQSPDEQAALMRDLYPTITKKSIDYGIMEPASHDPDVTIACVPLDLEWKDIGSWTAYGSLANPDPHGNRAMLASAAQGQLVSAAQDQPASATQDQPASQRRTAPAAPAALFKESANTLVVSSEENHLIACLGCEDLVIIHTPDATLVCPRSRVEEIKKLHYDIRESFGSKFV